MTDIGTNSIQGKTESWLSDKDSDLSDTPCKNSFHCFRKDRETGKGGGVLLLIPKAFQGKVRKYLHMPTQSFESLWVELKI